MTEDTWENEGGAVQERRKPRRKRTIKEQPCWAKAIDEEPICRVHNSYWSKQQSYCEIVLTRHSELAR